MNFVGAMPIRSYTPSWDSNPMRAMAYPATPAPAPKTIFLRLPGISFGRPWMSTNRAARELAESAMALVSPHPSSVGLRAPPPSHAGVARVGFASFANRGGWGQALRLALRPDGCAQPTTSDP